jgi:16S rRNA processing protein RimM
MAASGARNPPETMPVGRVAKAHGIRGEVRVVPHWQDSDALDSVSEVWLEDGAQKLRPYAVEFARRVPKAFLVKFAGVDDRSAAERLHGFSVLVERALLPALDEGEFYLADLVGAKVMAPEGFLGDVIGITSHPTVDVLVVRCSDGRVVEQPLAEPWLKRVDAAEKIVELHSSDGLI